ncbi:MAG: hypothetical protein PHS64_00535, partial [Candidatus Omnitrophica bacterium]|nr:hypothetical protein [Candidatus Omnitrophota bacterium]
VIAFTEPSITFTEGEKDAIVSLYNKNQNTVQEVYAANADTSSNTAATNSSVNLNETAAKDSNGDGTINVDDVIYEMNVANNYFYAHVQPLLDAVGIVTDGAGHITSGIENINVVAELDPSDPVVAQYTKNQVTVGEIYEAAGTEENAAGATVTPNNINAKDSNNDGVKDVNDVLYEMNRANTYFNEHIDPLLDAMGIVTDAEGHITAGIENIDVMAQLDPSDPIVAQYTKNQVTVGDLADILDDGSSTGSGISTTTTVAKDSNHDGDIDIDDVLFEMGRANTVFNANSDPVLDAAGAVIANDGHITNANNIEFTDTQLERLSGALEDYIEISNLVAADLEAINSELFDALEGYGAITAQVEANKMAVNGQLFTALDSYMDIAQQVEANRAYVVANNPLYAELSKYGEIVAQVEANSVYVVSKLLEGGNSTADPYAQMDAFLTGFTPEQQTYIIAAARLNILEQRMNDQYGEQGADTIIAAIDGYYENAEDANEACEYQDLMAGKPNRYHDSPAHWALEDTMESLQADLARALKPYGVSVSGGTIENALINEYLMTRSVVQIAAQACVDAGVDLPTQADLDRYVSLKQAADKLFVAQQITKIFKSYGIDQKSVSPLDVIALADWAGDVIEFEDVRTIAILYDATGAGSSSRTINLEEGYDDHYQRNYSVSEGWGNNSDESHSYYTTVRAINTGDILASYPVWANGDLTDWGNLLSGVSLYNIKCMQLQFANEQDAVAIINGSGLIDGTVTNGGAYDTSDDDYNERRSLKDYLASNYCPSASREQLLAADAQNSYYRDYVLLPSLAEQAANGNAQAQADMQYVMNNAKNLDGTNPAAGMTMAIMTGYQRAGIMTSSNSVSEMYASGHFSLNTVINEDGETVLDGNIRGSIGNGAELFGHDETANSQYPSHASPESAANDPMAAQKAYWDSIGYVPTEQELNYFINTHVAADTVHLSESDLAAIKSNYQFKYVPEDGQVSATWENVGQNGQVYKDKTTNEYYVRSVDGTYQRTPAQIAETFYVIPNDLPATAEIAGRSNQGTVYYDAVSQTSYISLNGNGAIDSEHSAIYDATHINLHSTATATYYGVPVNDIAQQQDSLRFGDVIGVSVNQAIQEANIPKDVYLSAHQMYEYAGRYGADKAAVINWEPSNGGDPEKFERTEIDPGTGTSEHVVTYTRNGVTRPEQFSNDPNKVPLAYNEATGETAYYIQNGNSIITEDRNNSVVLQQNGSSENVGSLGTTDLIDFTATQTVQYTTDKNNQPLTIITAWDADGKPTAVTYSTATSATTAHYEYDGNKVYVTYDATAEYDTTGNFVKWSNPSETITYVGGVATSVTLHDKEGDINGAILYDKKADGTEYSNAEKENMYMNGQYKIQYMIDGKVVVVHPNGEAIAGQGGITTIQGEGCEISEYHDPTWGEYTAGEGIIGGTISWLGHVLEPARMFLVERVLNAFVPLTMQDVIAWQDSYEAEHGFRPSFLAMPTDYDAPVRTGKLALVAAMIGAPVIGAYAAGGTTMGVGMLEGTAAPTIGQVVSGLIAGEIGVGGTTLVQAGWLAGVTRFAGMFVAGHLLDGALVSFGSGKLDLGFGYDLSRGPVEGAILPFVDHMLTGSVLLGLGSLALKTLVWAGTKAGVMQAVKVGVQESMGAFGKRTVSDGIKVAALQLPKDIVVGGGTFVAMDNWVALGTTGSFPSPKDQLASFGNGAVLAVEVRALVTGAGIVAKTVGETAWAQDKVVRYVDRYTTTKPAMYVQGGVDFTGSVQVGIPVSQVNPGITKTAWMSEASRVVFYKYFDKVGTYLVNTGINAPELLPISFRSTGGMVAAGPVFSLIGVGINSAFKKELTWAGKDQGLTFSQYLISDTSNFGKMALTIPVMVGALALPSSIFSSRAVTAFSTGHNWQTLGSTLWNLRNEQTLLGIAAKNIANGSTVGLITSADSALFIGGILGIISNLSAKGLQGLGLPSDMAMILGSDIAFISLLFIPGYSVSSRIGADKQNTPSGDAENVPANSPASVQRTLRDQTRKDRSLFDYGSTYGEGEGLIGGGMTVDQMRDLMIQAERGDVTAQNRLDAAYRNNPGLYNDQMRIINNERISARDEIIPAGNQEANRAPSATSELPAGTPIEDRNRVPATESTASGNDNIGQKQQTTLDQFDSSSNGIIDRVSSFFKPGMNGETGIGTSIVSKAPPAETSDISLPRDNVRESADVSRKTTQSTLKDWTASKQTTLRNWINDLPSQNRTETRTNERWALTEAADVANRADRAAQRLYSELRNTDRDYQINTLKTERSAASQTLADIEVGKVENVSWTETLSRIEKIDREIALLENEVSLTPREILGLRTDDFSSKDLALSVKDIARSVLEGQIQNRLSVTPKLDVFNSHEDYEALRNAIKNSAADREQVKKYIDTIKDNERLLTQYRKGDALQRLAAETYERMKVDPSFEVRDAQIEFALLLLKGVEGSISLGFAKGKTTAYKIALAALAKSSKVTLFVTPKDSNLQELLNDARIQQLIANGRFSLVQNGKPVNSKAQVWLTDGRGFEEMTRYTRNVKDLAKIGSICIDEYAEFLTGSPLVSGELGEVSRAKLSPDARQEFDKQMNRMKVKVQASMDFLAEKNIRLHGKIVLGDRLYSSDRTEFKDKPVDLVIANARDASGREIPNSFRFTESSAAEIRNSLAEQGIKISDRELNSIATALMFQRNADFFTTVIDGKVHVTPAGKGIELVGTMFADKGLATALTARESIRLGVEGENYLRSMADANLQKITDEISPAQALDIVREITEGKVKVTGASATSMPRETAGAVRADSISFERAASWNSGDARIIVGDRNANVNVANDVVRRMNAGDINKAAVVASERDGRAVEQRIDELDPFVTVYRFGGSEAEQVRFRDFVKNTLPGISKNPDTKIVVIAPEGLLSTGSNIFAMDAARPYRAAMYAVGVYSTDIALQIGGRVGETGRANMPRDGIRLTVYVDSSRNSRLTASEIVRFNGEGNHEIRSSLMLDVMDGREQYADQAAAKYLYVARQNERTRAIESRVVGGVSRDVMDAAQEMQFVFDSRLETQNRNEALSYLNAELSSGNIVRQQAAEIVLGNVLNEQEWARMKMVDMDGYFEDMPLTQPTMPQATQAKPKVTLTDEVSIEFNSRILNRATSRLHQEGLLTNEFVQGTVDTWVNNQRVAIAEQGKDADQIVRTTGRITNIADMTMASWAIYRENNVENYKKLVETTNKVFFDRMNLSNAASAETINLWGGFTVTAKVNGHYVDFNYSIDRTQGAAIREQQLKTAINHLDEILKIADDIKEVYLTSDEQRKLLPVGFVKVAINIFKVQRDRLQIELDNLNNPEANIDEIYSKKIGVRVERMNSNGNALRFDSNYEISRNLNDLIDAIEEYIRSTKMGDNGFKTSHWYQVDAIKDILSNEVVNYVWNIEPNGGKSSYIFFLEVLLTSLVVGRKPRIMLLDAFQVDRQQQDIPNQILEDLGFSMVYMGKDSIHEDLPELIKKLREPGSALVGEGSAYQSVLLFADKTNNEQSAQFRELLNLIVKDARISLDELGTLFNTAPHIIGTGFEYANGKYSDYITAAKRLMEAVRNIEIEKGKKLDISDLAALRKFVFMPFEIDLGDLMVEAQSRHANGEEYASIFESFITGDYEMSAETRANLKRLVEELKALLEAVRIALDKERATLELKGLRPEESLEYQKMTREYQSIKESLPSYMKIVGKTILLDGRSDELSFKFVDLLAQGLSYKAKGKISAGEIFLLESKPETDIMRFVLDAFRRSLYKLEGKDVIGNYDNTAMVIQHVLSQQDRRSLEEKLLELENHFKLGLTKDNIADIVIVELPDKTRKVYTKDILNIKGVIVEAKLDNSLPIKFATLTRDPEQQIAAMEEIQNKLYPVQFRDTAICECGIPQPDRRPSNIVEAFMDSAIFTGKLGTNNAWNADGVWSNGDADGVIMLQFIKRAVENGAQIVVKSGTASTMQDGFERLGIRYADRGEVDVYSYLNLDNHVQPVGDFRYFVDNKLNDEIGNGNVMLLAIEPVDIENPVDQIMAAVQGREDLVVIYKDGNGFRVNKDESIIEENIKQRVIKEVTHNKKVLIVFPPSAVEGTNIQLISYMSKLAEELGKPASAQDVEKVALARALETTDVKINRVMIGSLTTDYNRLGQTLYRFRFNGNGEVEIFGRKYDKKWDTIYVIGGREEMTVGEFVMNARARQEVARREKNMEIFDWANRLILNQIFDNLKKYALAFEREDWLAGIEKYQKEFFFKTSFDSHLPIDKKWSSGEARAKKTLNGYVSQLRAIEDKLADYLPLEGRAY